MQPVSRVQTWIFKDRLLPNPDGTHLALECGHLLTLVLEEILEASVTWMWSYHEVCYRPAPVPWIDCGWEQSIPGSQPVSLICMFCHLLEKIMLSCKIGQQKHWLEPTNSQGMPGVAWRPWTLKWFCSHPISRGTLTVIDGSELQRLVLILPTWRTEEQEAPTQLTCNSNNNNNKPQRGRSGSVSMVFPCYSVPLLRESQLLQVNHVLGPQREGGWNDHLEIWPRLPPADRLLETRWGMCEIAGWDLCHCFGDWQEDSWLFL